MNVTLFSRLLFLSMGFVNRCMSYSKCNRCILCTSGDNTYFGDYICRGRSDFIRSLKINLHIEDLNLNERECSRCCSQCKYGNPDAEERNEDLCLISATFCKMLGERPCEERD